VPFFILTTLNIHLYEQIQPHLNISDPSISRKINKIQL
jgi:hypothetical protein